MASTTKTDAGATSSTAVPIEVVKRVVRTIAKQQNFDDFTLNIEPLYTNGANYMGELYVIDVLQEGKETLKLFAKASNTPEHLREKVPANRVYRRETFVYTELADAYRDLQAENGVSQSDAFRFPEYYGSSVGDMEEVIVLENLAAKGYVLNDRFQPLEWDYAKAALEQIAKFHALSFALERQKPELFKRLVKNNPNLITDAQNIVARRMEPSKMENAKCVDAEHLSKVIKYCEENEGNFYSKHYQPMSKYAVLGHGDYRVSNTLVKYEGDSVSSLIPVDYQTVYYGSPHIDIIYFLFCGTDERFRRKHFDASLNHYRACLADHLQKLSLDIDGIYPKLNFYFELRDKLSFGLYVALTVLAGVLMDINKLMKIADSMDPENEEIVKIHCKNPRYLERLNGIVRDLVSYGVLKD